MVAPWCVGCPYCCLPLDRQAGTEIAQNVQLVPCIGRLEKGPIGSGPLSLDLRLVVFCVTEGSCC